MIDCSKVRRDGRGVKCDFVLWPITKIGLKSPLRIKVF